MAVHSRIGPGLPESTYEACLQIELEKRGYSVQSQVMLPLVYDEIEIPTAYRIDLLVEDAVVVELKSASEITELHEAQLLTYLKLSGKKLGLIINFNVLHLRDGIKRKVNKL